MSGLPQGNPAPSLQAGRSNRSVLAPSRGRGAAGFTLLEVLVAFTILALMLTVLLRIFADGFRGMSAAEAHAAAALHAQAALAGVGAEIPLAAGEWSGEYDDGFLWQVSIEPYLEPALAASQRSFRLYQVFATARHASGATAVTLSGLRIAGTGPSLPGEGEGEGDAGGPQ
jgi:general secretion pathway protein I